MNLKYKKLALKIMLFIVVAVILVFWLVICPRFGSAIHPSALIIHSLNINGDRMELVVSNTSSACNINKCITEVIDDDVYITIYESGIVRQNTLNQLNISIEDVNRVYIKGRTTRSKMLIWER